MRHCTLKGSCGQAVSRGTSEIKGLREAFVRVAAAPSSLRPILADAETKFSRALHATEGWGFTFLHYIFRPTSHDRGVGEHDLTKDKPIEEHADGGELRALLRSVIQTDRRASRFFPRTRNLRQFYRSRASPVRYGIPYACANSRKDDDLCF